MPKNATQHVLVSTDTPSLSSRIDIDSLNLIVEALGQGRAALSRKNAIKQELEKAQLQSFGFDDLDWLRWLDAINETNAAWAVMRDALAANLNSATRRDA